MNEEYRGFIYVGCEQIAGILPGNLTQWKTTGCIGFKHSNGANSELTRFGFPMTVDDEDVAKCFWPEIARLLLDTSFSDFAKALAKARSG